MKTTDLDSIIEIAANTNDGSKRKRIAASARMLVKPKKVKRIGAPTKYTEAKATAICKAVSNGQTLSSVAKELDLTPDTIYKWLRDYPAFADTFQYAKEDAARSLLDELLDEAKAAEPERALLLKTKSAIFTWAIARFNPREFSDSRKIKLEAEVNVRHVHELPIEQRRKIAEAWLASQIEDDTAGRVIEHDDTDNGVSIVEEPEREIPKRRKSPALPGKTKPIPGNDDSSNTRWRGKNDADAD